MVRGSSDRSASPEAGTGDHALSRRSFLGAAGVSALGVEALTAGLRPSSSAGSIEDGSAREPIEPFYGAGPQGGIVAAAQSNTYFASLDLSTERRSELIELLRAWSHAGANLAAGITAGPLSIKEDEVEPDSGEAIGIGPARLTVTFGFGPGLFEKEGSDRYGLKSMRPAALVDLPRFPNDQLIEAKTGGDLTVQACADDPQVAFHAVRQLSRLADGFARIRWVQAGFNETSASSGTPRNLMGFKDGTINPTTEAQQQEFLWVGSEGPAWMRGGTYLVARRIRISLEHWDLESLSVQEQVIGRHKISGAPLGKRSEFDPLDLDATDSDGKPVIPIDAHVRLAAPQNNKGQMFLRRSYAYNDGVDLFTERWPPWQRALLYDAGLLFCAYQRDPRKGFIPIFRNLAENDALGQFTTQTGSVIVALPPAATGKGHFVGEGLFL